MPLQEANTFSSTGINAGLKILKLVLLTSASGHDFDACRQVLAPVGVIDQRVEPSVGVGGSISGKMVSSGNFTPLMSDRVITSSKVSVDFLPAFLLSEMGDRPFNDGPPLAPE